ncbi:hypothetical protein MMC29_001406 [Sticta canariensis]|nr:hypothetical protein [Sticta canariensis]
MASRTIRSQNAFNAMSQKSFDIEPLRASSSEEEDTPTEYLKGWHNPQSMQGRPFLSLRNFLAIQLGVFALYSLGLFVLLAKQSGSCKNAPGLMYSPAIEAIQMQRQVLHNSLSTMNPFKGPPGPEQVEAWEILLTSKYSFRSTLNISLIMELKIPTFLSDGSGDYLASLDVYHELHCVKYIHHYIHGDYYNEPTAVPAMMHVDHCIDTIRKFIMCRADVAIQTLHWEDDQRTPAHNFETEHECLNWGVLDAWAASRMVDIHDPKMLTHPTLGEYSESNVYNRMYASF